MYMRKHIVNSTDFVEQPRDSFGSYNETNYDDLKQTAEWGNCTRNWLCDKICVFFMFKGNIVITHAYFSYYAIKREIEID